MSAASFQVPDGTNDLISRHLVTSAEIARRAKVTRPAVANWLQRYPELAALAIPMSTEGGDLLRHVFWWPQVQECLARLGLPSESAQRRGRKPKRATSTP